ncbi:hypothetical protein B0T36_00585 [Nocardia donostiensis]|uniref:DUF4245 domain-containing protein n=1 Tax=Nocardia donostiensis TaxID=1538463 RepID=UPI0009DB3E05|nr:DUF4245 domain-containing protein [Nocardia donostiensis]OQS17152.1 hypothetical protein B0T36_00585 [Nocardia donostiensis]
MSYQKPRILHDYRDLFFSLIPLVLIVVVFAGAASQCSFAVNGPTQGPIPSFDAEAALQSDATSLSFPIREPELPASWKPNSGSRDTIAEAGGGAVSTVGYITDQGTYMQLNQSSATEELLVTHTVGRRYATGTEQIGTQKWVVYDEPGAEPAWVSDFGDVRVLIRGAGNNEAFTTLAQAVGTAQPLTP